MNASAEKKVQISSIAETWMEVRAQGLYCKPADCYIDPVEPVGRAIITHGHADHARSGHGEVFATPETIAIMRTRYYTNDDTHETALAYDARTDLGGGVTLWFASAGHILGSAQAVLEYNGQRVVAAGDFKRHPDPTCAPFEVVPCDVFITEATFALPVFQHPPLESEVDKLMRSMRALPGRTHIVGVYALGKCQRVMKTLRLAGYAHPFYLHGALKRLTELYESYGQDFGAWELVSEIPRADKGRFRGKLVLCPPAQINDRWSRRFADPLPTVASGWMQIRARARQKRAEMALVVSDHADWGDLIRTCKETGAPHVWITHGRVEALEYALRREGINAKGLNLIGRDEGVE
ncbi:ligase-associated DNA damage response exonuclease [Robiginitomaculum antarcticum]|uniref:ligase-associated DNA damage response exonuclease n=1 Tax=Robiginitomaculum antarcticum TaxID=437507 RepID=UPI00037F0F5F|nr:ligase-associated DNA damage response exonuclease [Robiginitomaculum antarcticum]